LWRLFPFYRPDFLSYTNIIEKRVRELVYDRHKLDDDEGQTTRWRRVHVRVNGSMQYTRWTRIATFFLRDIGDVKSRVTRTFERERSSVFYKRRGFRLRTRSCRCRAECVDSVPKHGVRKRPEFSPIFSVTTTTTEQIQSHLMALPILARVYVTTDTSGIYVLSYLWIIRSLCKYSKADPISHANSLIEFSLNLTSCPKWYLRSPPNNRSDTMNRSSSSANGERELLRKSVVYRVNSITVSKYFVSTRARRTRRNTELRAYRRVGGVFRFGRVSRTVEYKFAFLFSSERSRDCRCT